MFHFKKKTNKATVFKRNALMSRLLKMKKKKHKQVFIINTLKQYCSHFNQAVDTFYKYKEFNHKQQIGGYLAILTYFNISLKDMFLLK